MQPKLNSLQDQVFEESLQRGHRSHHRRWAPLPPRLATSPTLTREAWLSHWHPLGKPPRKEPPVTPQQNFSYSEAAETPILRQPL